MSKRWYVSVLRECSCCIANVLHTHLLIHAEIYIYILDTYRRNDNRRRKDKDAVTKTDAWRKTQEDFFNNILPLTLLQGFERVFQGFACERVLETEHKLHILTPLL